MKVAEGIVVRAVRKAVRGVTVGRARMRAIRERADAIVVDVESNVDVSSQSWNWEAKVNGVLMRKASALIGQP